MSLHLHANPADQVIGPATYRGTSYVGPVIVSSAKETLARFQFDHVTVENDIAAGEHAKWGVLLYNELHSQYRGLVVRGIDKEHGVYAHSPRGDWYQEDALIEDCGAQGIQVVYRSPESDTPDGHKEVGLHSLVSCTVRKCGQPRGYGRASFAVSFFGFQDGDGQADQQPWDCPVRLVDTSIEHDAQGKYELRGALLVIGRPRLEVVGGQTVYKGLSDRATWKLRGVREVIVTDHHFEGQRPIDIDDMPGQPVERVFFGGCSGSVAIRINGRVVGNTQRNLRWAR